MRVGILTGGGDCPGLNAVIRAVWKRSRTYGDSLVGFMYGWRGAIEGISMPLEESDVRGILHTGGTILRTSGDNPFHTDTGAERVVATLAQHELDALVVIGGEGTMAGAARMWNEHKMPVIGVPKTIDNDLPGTDVTFGFDTALGIATEALDRLHTTAESHNRVIVCEVMGRTAGWIALWSGIAGGANVILLPEQNMDIEDAADIVLARSQRGKNFSVIVVGEGYEPTSRTGLFNDRRSTERLDEYGFPRLGGVSHTVADAIENITGFETRVTILGHIQRGGTPTAADRVLASRFGVRAVDCLHEGDFGKLIAKRGNRIAPVPITDALGPIRQVPERMFDLVETFNG